MKQFSENGTPVELELLSGHLLFIDPLYLQNISENKDAIDVELLLNPVRFVQHLEEAIFPYGGGILLGYKKVSLSNQTFQLDLHKLKDFGDKNEENIKQSFNKAITTFAVDSGSFLILDLDNFNKLLHLIKYDDLVDAALDNKFQVFLDKAEEQLSNKAWAYIISPGIDSELDFQGSGSFIIED